VLTVQVKGEEPVSVLVKVGGESAVDEASADWRGHDWCTSRVLCVCSHSGVRLMACPQTSARADEGALVRRHALTTSFGMSKLECARLRPCSRSFVPRRLCLGVSQGNGRSSAQPSQPARYSVQSGGATVCDQCRRSGFNLYPCSAPANPA
jgi:hypothetical protein